jgi:hypothetical protein
MNLLPFYKRKTMTTPASTEIEKEVPVYIPVMKENDFDEEVRNTRSNELLMSALRSRAQEPATHSLEEIRKRLSIK